MAVRIYESLMAAADRTGVSVKTLRRKIADGSLPVYRCGRILRLDPQEVDGLLSYPSSTLLAQLIDLNVPLTIGSDAHDPRDAGAGIAELMHELSLQGLQHLSYFRQRQRTDIALDDLLSAITPKPKTGILP